METPAVKAQRLLEKLYKQRLGEVDKIPPGFMSLEGYSKAWKMKRTQTDRLLKRAVKSKMIKVVRLRQVTNGKLRYLSFYG